MISTPRPARSDDYDAYARLLPLFASDEPIPSPEQWRTEIAPDTLVVERDSAVVGFLYGVAFSRIGYVRQLVVAPSYRRGGLGRSLMHAVADRFRTLGCHTWCLNLRPHHAATLAFYEQMGLRVRTRASAFRLDWGDVARLPPSPPCMVASATPDDDDDITAAFSVERDRLAEYRAFGARTQVVARDGDGRVVGYACFDPSLPGAFPFRVRERQHLRALLEAIRDFAHPVDGDLRVVAEDGYDEVQSFIAAGGERVLEFVHLGGVLGVTPSGGPAPTPP